MRLRFKNYAAPLWAIFCAACLLILRSFQEQNLSCESIRQQDIHEICSSYSIENNPTPPTVKSKFPFHPFEEGQPKQVVILTYQRCGSTFFGEFFNENPEAFYMFEPLDSLYTSMYGTRQGWNVPSDIMNYQNGTQRILPKEEKSRVSQFLFNLLTCNADSLPTETLVNRYFVQFTLEFLNTDKYVQCAMKLLVRTSKCNALAPIDYCGPRFGNKSEEVLTECRRALSDADYRKSHQNGSLFDKYIECLTKLRKMLDEHCTPIWKTTCLSRSLRAVKLVRSNMDTMEPLLKALPNLRIIHLIRDPRAVVLSRHGFDASVRGIYSGLDANHTMAREAYLYCRSVVSDVRRRKELEAIYPGRIIPVIYDEVVQDVKGYIKDVYEFLGMSTPEDVTCWYLKSKYPKHYGGRLNSTAIANRWQEVISVMQNKEIEVACGEFFQVVKHNWANRHF